MMFNQYNNTMKKKIIGKSGVITLILIATLSLPDYGQSENSFISKYLNHLPGRFEKNNGDILKYRMQAVYTNMDLYGNFSSKTKVTGEYTRGLPGDTVAWNNVYISGSASAAEPFKQGTKKEFMENFRYVPSPEMLTEGPFKDFPSSPENIFARNLVWDMFSFEIFAWNYFDSLKINTLYIIPDISGQFNMADIGKYSHNKITLCWNGVSVNNNVICAVIDFTAIDNKLEINMGQIKTKGTEQYWGSVMVSLKTKNIEQGVMYSGTIQEIEVTGMKDKFLVKTIRELVVNKIQ